MKRLLNPIGNVLKTSRLIKPSAAITGINMLAMDGVSRGDLLLVTRRFSRLEDSVSFCCLVASRAAEWLQVIVRTHGGGPDSMRLLLISAREARPRPETSHAYFLLVVNR